MLEHPQALRIMRFAWLVYALLLIYGSLYPFTDWYWPSEHLEEFLFKSLPRYYTRFDLLVNLLAYAPFGFFTLLALYPRLRSNLALIITLLLSGILSIALESIQGFLAWRIASNLDVLMNTLGALLGALLALPACTLLLRYPQIRQWRKSWFSHEASLGCVLLGLWLAAQIYPQVFMFVVGQSSSLNQFMAIPFLSQLMIHQLFYPFMLMVLTLLHLLAISTLLLLMVYPQFLRWLFLICLLFSVAVFRTVALFIQFDAQQMFSWITIAIVLALFFSLILFYHLQNYPPKSLKIIATLSLILSYALANILPENPYYSLSLDTPVLSSITNLRGLADAINFIWPVLALLFLIYIHFYHRKKKA